MEHYLAVKANEIDLSQQLELQQLEKSKRQRVYNMIKFSS